LGDLPHPHRGQEIRAELLPALFLKRVSGQCAEQGNGSQLTTPEAVGREISPYSRAERARVGGNLPTRRERNAHGLSTCAFLETHGGAARWVGALPPTHGHRGGEWGLFPTRGVGRRERVASRIPAREAIRNGRREIPAPAARPMPLPAATSWCGRSWSRTSRRSWTSCRPTSPSRSCGRGAPSPGPSCPWRGPRS